jgi:hypothetical protein
VNEHEPQQVLGRPDLGVAVLHLQLFVLVRQLLVVLRQVAQKLLPVVLPIRSARGDGGRGHASPLPDVSDLGQENC